MQFTREKLIYYERPTSMAYVVVSAPDEDNAQLLLEYIYKKLNSWWL